MVVGEAVADGLKVRRERIEIGQEVPMLTPEEDMGNPMLQAMCDKQGRLNNKTLKWCDDGVPGPGDGFFEEQVVAREKSNGTQLEPNSGCALLEDISAEEHMEWATTLQHQGNKVMDTPIPDELVEAWRLCAQQSPPEVIDAERDNFLAWLRQLEEDLNLEREHWFNTQVAEGHKPLPAKVHVPLIAALQRHFGIKDELLVQHLTVRRDAR